MGHDNSHHAPYFAVFIALCVCTAISFAADFIPFNSRIILIVIVMSVAVAKALFVLTYFMHLKFEGKWKLILLAPTVILAIGLPLALVPDVGVPYYEPLEPQRTYLEHSPGAVVHESAEH